jgi:hypothetical protein
MGDMTMWRYCPFCGGQWTPGDALKTQLASGRIVCGRCGVEWNAPAKPAELNEREAFDLYMSLRRRLWPNVEEAKVATPQSVTMTQPKIDLVLDLSQAEADRLGPPMRHRCAIDPGWHYMTANCFGIKEIER